MTRGTTSRSIKRVPLKLDAGSTQSGSSGSADSLSLADLRNIGKAMLRDFRLLKIRSVEQLARCDPDELYARVQHLTKSRHDPCVWDTYAAAIHQAKTCEALPWWSFTKVRKRRESSGKFPARYTP